MEVTTRRGVPDEAVRATGREILVAGTAVGMAGGVLMALWVVLGAALNDVPPLEPLRGMGATFVEADPSDVGPGLLLYGLALHLAVSALLGVLFVAMLPRGLPPASAAVVGIGYAWVAMAITTSAVLPLANAEMRGDMRAIGGSWVIAHALYGAALGFGPWLRPRLAGRVRALRPA